MSKFSRFAIGLCTIMGFGLTLAACDAGPPTAQQIEQAKAQQSQSQLNKTTPIPVLPLSQERINLVKRAERINVQNMSSCVTLFAENGAVVAFFPVAGKVSSLNSYLLSGEQIVRAPLSGGGSTPIVIEQPDIDGAYGSNADGIFFFTSDTDAYVEWKGPYFWSDQCLRPAGTPLLVETAVVNGNATPLPAGDTFKSE